MAALAHASWSATLAGGGTCELKQVINSRHLQRKAVIKTKSTTRRASKSCSETRLLMYTDWSELKQGETRERDKTGLLHILLAQAVHLVIVSNHASA